MSDVAVQIHSCLDREDWLKKRTESGFGASDASALFGHGYKSALSLLLQRIERSVGDPSTEKQDLATALEPSLVAHYAKRTGRRAWPLRVPTLFWRYHVPHVFATPDGFSSSGGEGEDADRVLQIKTDARTPEAWEDGPPLAYKIQVQQEMFATGLPKADIACLFYGGGDLAFRIYEEVANEEFQKLLVERLTAAWNVVLDRRAGGNAPLPEPTADDAAAVAKLYAPKPLVVHQFSTAEAEEAKDWLSTRGDRMRYAKVASAIEEIEKGIKHRLIARMAGAEIGVLPDGTKIKATLRERAAFPMSESKWIDLAPVKDKKPRGEGKELIEG